MMQTQVGGLTGSFSPQKLGPNRVGNQT